MVLDTLDTHRLEGTGTDMQGNEGGIHPLRADRLEQRLIEVQAGGRGRHRTGALGVDGLVALAVGRIVRSVDIGRQRHVPDPLQQRQHRLGESEFEQSVVALQHLRAATAFDEDPRTGLGRLAGAYVGKHPVLVEHALDQDFQLATGLLLAEQARRDHPGIVEHHQVARTQVVQEIGELSVGEGSRRAIQRQQAACAAFRQGMTGDQGLGQVEMKIGDTHGETLERPRSLPEMCFPRHEPD